MEARSHNFRLARNLHGICNAMAANPPPRIGHMNMQIDCMLYSSIKDARLIPPSNHSCLQNQTFPDSISKCITDEIVSSNVVSIL